MPGGTTPAQTIGPFFAVMLPLGSNRLADPTDPAAVTVEGRVLDGEGAPVTDALIEIWQAGADGRYRHPADLDERDGFAGFGRCATDGEGRYSFVTVKPGRVPSRDERLQAPHINVSIFARGLLNRLVTRIYFADEAPANATDPVLSSIADEGVRQTLLAASEGEGRYRFDIRLQGERETVFFAV